MMDCTEFKNWLVTTGFPRRKNQTRADRHMNGCQHCRDLYMLDSFAESQVRDTLTQKAPAADFFPELEAKINRMEKPSAVSPVSSGWVRRRLPAVALVALLLVVVLNPFATSPITLNQVERIVAAEHSITDVQMDVRFENSQGFSPWLSNTFDYAVVLPDLKQMGLSPKGGKVCDIAGRKSVYLVCERSGKKTSLFIIDASEVEFTLSSDKRYRISDRTLEIEMWQQNGLIYVTVSSIASKNVA